MAIIKESNINKARKQILDLKKKHDLIIVQSQDDEFNRKILENKDVDILLNLELNNRKDRMKQRDSGLNEILCKIATKNNIKIGIDLSKIKKLRELEKAKILSRIRQNLKLCRRTKTKYVIIDKDKFQKNDILSFMQTLGASTIQAKDSIEF